MAPAIPGPGERPAEPGVVRRRQRQPTGRTRRSLAPSVRPLTHVRVRSRPALAVAFAWPRPAGWLATAGPPDGPGARWRHRSVRSGTVQVRAHPPSRPPAP